jgi:hypothetical protein
MSDIYSQTCVQQPPLRPEKRGRYAEGYMKKDQRSVGFRLAGRAADWPLLTGGHYSEVAVRTGLTVDTIV